MCIRDRDSVQRVLHFGALCPKWTVFIKFLPSGLRDLCGTGRRTTVRARGVDNSKKTVFQTQQVRCTYELRDSGSTNKAWCTGWSHFPSPSCFCSQYISIETLHSSTCTQPDWMPTKFQRYGYFCLSRAGIFVCVCVLGTKSHPPPACTKTQLNHFHSLLHVFKFYARNRR